MLNSTLLNSAQKVINNSSPAQFNITAKFISSDEGSSFAFSPLFIDSLIIDKDFLDNFADEIDINLTISPKDYALMQDQGQNLLCVLTIVYINKYGKKVYDPAPIQKQYHALINNPVDVRKSIPDIQAHTEPSTPISLRLVEPAIYKLRHVKINKIYQNQTPTQVIQDVTQTFDIKKLEMVPLDNIHRYDHVDISSYQGIDSVYQFLHNKLGLYQKGSNSYITDGVLYVYPPFETSPIYDRTLVFYQVDTGRFSGASIFHKVEGDSTSIVINTQPETADLSIAGSENEGTGFIFTRSSRMADGISAIDTEEGARFTEEPALSITLDNSRTAVKGLNNTFHIKSTDNPFPAMGRIISHQASLMSVIWPQADPFRIDPGHAVAYYYDRNGQMVRKTGIVEHAVFELTCGQKTGPSDVFSTMGQLILRLSPNESISF